MKLDASVAVPPAAVTATPTAPAACAGLVAVIVCGSTTMMVVAASPPIMTTDPAVKFVPVSVIAVPPAIGPLTGAT